MGRQMSVCSAQPCGCWWLLEFKAKLIKRRWNLKCSSLLVPAHFPVLIVTWGLVHLVVTTGDGARFRCTFIGKVLLADSGVDCQKVVEDLEEKQWRSSGY